MTLTVQLTEYILRELAPPWKPSVQPSGNLEGRSSATYLSVVRIYVIPNTMHLLARTLEDLEKCSVVDENSNIKQHRVGELQVHCIKY